MLEKFDIGKYLSDKISKSHKYYYFSQMKHTDIRYFNYTRSCQAHGTDACTETVRLPVFTLEQEERPRGWCMDKKNVIFVVDVSVSMLETMCSLKASIFAFRDLICGRTSLNQPLVTDEQFRANLPNFHLITFSDEGRLRWSNTPAPGSLLGTGEPLSFNALVDSLEVENSTNMGAGIELAYSLCPPNRCEALQGPDARASWIVVFTDGESNRGKQQTPEAFAKLASEKPPNVKIVSLGFGESFNSEILDNIGDFTYLENTESIPNFTGAFADEVLTCGVINTGVCFGRDNVDVVIGSKDVGWFSNGRKHYFGFIPTWEPPMTGELLSVKFTEIGPDGIYHYSVSERVDNFAPSQDLTPEIRSIIAFAKASKLVKEIYALSARGESRSYVQRKIKQILSEVEKWTEPGTEEAREMVKRFCKTALTTKNERNTPASLQLANGLQNQTSYMVPLFQTPSAISSSGAAVDLARTYL